MTQERFFVTGALGCIGAWVVRELLKEGAHVTVFDVAANPHRLRLILDDEQLDQVNFVTGNIASYSLVEEAIKNDAATHLIHLAALQVPFCKADPVLGASVNVVGTVNIFEAAKNCGLKHLAYASSIAVFGQSEDYPDGVAGDSSPLHPLNLYGVYKQANEGTARIYWQDHAVSSLGLRPYVVYGAGRDQGLTSGPSKAMLAAALGRPYHIQFGGQCVYQYTRDAARVFIEAARCNFRGAEVLNVRGSVVDMPEIIAAIERVEPGMRGKITFNNSALPFPKDVDNSRLRAILGNPKETPLEDGVAETIAIFKTAVRENKIDPEKIL